MGETQIPCGNDNQESKGKNDRDELRAVSLELFSLELEAPPPKVRKVRRDKELSPDFGFLECCLSDGELNAEAPAWAEASFPTIC